MHREARGHPPVSCNGVPLPDGTARHAATQERLNADTEGMHAKHAEGLESGMVVHRRDRRTELGGAEPARWPVSHPRAQRSSACICVRLLLASPRAARRRRTRPVATLRQNPMHQCNSGCRCVLSRCRAPSIPQRGSPSLLPRNETSMRCRQPGACAGLLPPHIASSHTKRNETSVRLAATFHVRTRRQSRFHTASVAGLRSNRPTTEGAQCWTRLSTPPPPTRGGGVYSILSGSRHLPRRGRSASEYTRPRRRAARPVLPRNCRRATPARRR